MSHPVSSRRHGGQLQGLFDRDTGSSGGDRPSRPRVDLRRIFSVGRRGSQIGGRRDPSGTRTETAKVNSRARADAADPQSQRSTPCFDPHLSLDVQIMIFPIRRNTR
jgi:hypothetical protein